MSSDENRKPRVQRHRRSVVAAVLGVAFIATGMIASTAEAATPVSDDPRATAFAGSINACPAGTTSILSSPNGTPMTNSLVSATYTNGGRYLQLTFNSSLAGEEILVFVKGANAYNAYDPVVLAANLLTMSDLRAPLNSKGNLPQISHYLVCQSDTPPPPPPLINTPPKIYVAYVDNFHDRASGQAIPYVPSPWKGDSGVVFVGCDTDVKCGKYDGGAIRIDNAATDTVTKELVSASVTIGDCTFNPWPALLPRTFAPGQSLILTQTGTDGPPQPAPCREAIDPQWWPYTNFDTSERPHDNRGYPTLADRVFNCDVSTGATPVIHLTFAGGTTIDVVDTNKVLNTGGIDSQACFGINEAAPWTAEPLPY